MKNQTYRLTSLEIKTESEHAEAVRYNIAFGDNKTFGATLSFLKDREKNKIFFLPNSYFTYKRLFKDQRILDVDINTEKGFVTFVFTKKLKLG